MWKYGKKMGYRISDIEYPTIKLPKHRLRYLSMDEEKRLLGELNPKRTGRGLKPFDEQSATMKQALLDVYDLVIILLDTGARHSEIANIEWNSISLEDRTIRLWRPKVQNESVLFMTERVYRVLRRRHQEKESLYVFANKAHGPRGYASQSIRKAFKRAGLYDCTIHTLRHTHATRLIQNGMSVYEVKEILGHSDIKTTMRYAHLEQKDVSSRARDVINRINAQVEKPDLKVV
jgi:integrase